MHRDHEHKLIGMFLYVIIRKLFVGPLCTAMVVTILAKVIVPKAFPAMISDPPNSFDIDMDELLPLSEENSDCAGNAWQEKVVELSNRGISLRQLLYFYEMLGRD